MSDFIFEGTPKSTVNINKISLFKDEQKINVINPQSDPVTDSSWHIDSRTQSEKFLAIICNSLSLLNELEFSHWNELCQRNCHFLEKSKHGIYITDFDTKEEQRIFKAKKSENDYIEKLGHQNLRKSPKRNVQLNFNSLELGTFYNPRMPMDLVKIQQHSIADLYTDYLENPQKLVGYINLAKNLEISRA